MYLASNKWGYNILEYIKISENEMCENKNYKPISGSLIVVECEEKILIAFNRSRQQWEIPAGGIEEGEAPRDCAIRELYEETCHEVQNLEFRGLVKIYDSRKEKVKYQALYCVKISKLQTFQENEEMDKIILWDLKDNIGEFDEVDKKIIDLCLMGK